MNVQTKKMGNTLWFKVDGDLVGADADEFGSSARTALTAEDVNVILEASAMETVDSHGLEALSGLAQQVRQNHGEITLAHPGKLLMDVLAATRLARLFTVMQ